MKTKLLILSIAALCLSAAPALGDIYNTRPYDTSPSGLSQLQGVFSGIGSTIDAYNDQSPIAAFTHMVGGQSSASYIATVSWAAGPIEFGLYELGNTSNTLKLINWTAPGSPPPGYSVRIEFDATNVTSYHGLTQIDQASYFPDFGFYAKAIGYTYYSEDSLNGGDQRMLTYKGKGDAVDLDGAGGLPAKSDGAHWYVAAETWTSFNSPGNTDWTDLVALFESIVPVPVPAAILLGILGMSVAGIKLRKYA